MNKFRTMIVALGLVLAASLSAVAGNLLSAQYIRMMNGATLAWVVRVTSGGSLQVADQRAAGLAVPVSIQLDAATGGVKILSATSAQLSALTPGSTGVWAFNTTTNHLVFSTGTAIAQWSAYCPANQGACTGI